MEMSDRLGTWARTAVWALPVYGVLLAVGTITQQPDYRTDFAAYADYITTSTFLVSHVIASIGGAVVGLVGMSALSVLTEDVSPRRARWGFVSSASGQIGLASIFGVAAFAQPAIGRAFLDGEHAVSEAINTDVYGGPLFATAALSLLAFVAGGILLGGAARRVGTWPRWTGVTFTTSITVFAVGVFVEVPFLQPLAAIGLTVAGVAIARAAGVPDRAGTVEFADEVAVR
jgi:hypothetical protein